MTARAPTGYLADGLEKETSELADVLKLIDETAATLLTTLSGEWWPYVVRRRRKAKSGESVSTNTMNAFALAATAGRLLKSPLAPDPPVEEMLGSSSRSVLKVKRGKPAARLAELVRPAVQVVADREITSETYGPNDPFTLGWLAPLVATFDLDSDRVAAALRDRFKRAWKNAESRPWPVFEPPVGTGKALPHAFPLLRVVHLSKTADQLGLDVNQDVPPACAEAFEATVHRQLANSTIADASFDAAELIFAFEGLLCMGVAPSAALEERFFEATASLQEYSPSWRPLKPFIATDRGLVLLPLSVEGASSLARICRELDRRGDRGRRFSRHVALFRQYVRWLESQRVRFESGSRDLRGWHSEHVRDAETIHTWQTSQVLVFLLLYAELFRRHIAEQALAAANLSIKHDPEEPKGESQSWLTVRQAFVEHDKGPKEHPSATTNRSAVLFGPPGTGKTTLAEWLAAELEWPLITITPSDFMAEGTAAVEARAKAVFTALNRQRRAVVVFDEIDRLILDRELDEYRRQEGAFQLMTPSMLTKLNDLRRAGQVIFLVATNFVERIDRAITRPGRFDKQFAIVPPNAEDRRRFLEAQWKMKSGATIDLESVAVQTWLATYGELKDLVKEAASVEELKAKADQFDPSISLESYSKRMKSRVRTPWEEVLELTNLYPDGTMSEVDREVVAVAEREKAAVEERRVRRGAPGAQA